jgi:hypothetical protein
LTVNKTKTVYKTHSLLLTIPNEETIHDIIVPVRKIKTNRLIIDLSFDFEDPADLNGNGQLKNTFTKCLELLDRCIEISEITYLKVFFFSFKLGIFNFFLKLVMGRTSFWTSGLDVSMAEEIVSRFKGISKLKITRIHTTELGIMRELIKLPKLSDITFGECNVSTDGSNPGPGELLATCCERENLNSITFGPLITSPGESGCLLTHTSNTEYNGLKHLIYKNITIDNEVGIVSSMMLDGWLKSVQWKVMGGLSQGDEQYLLSSCEPQRLLTIPRKRIIIEKLP